MDIRDIQRMNDECRLGDIDEIETETSLEDLTKYFEAWKEEYRNKNIILYQDTFRIVD